MPARWFRLLRFFGTSRFLEERQSCAGKKIFASNHCTSCHGDAASGAPDPLGTKGFVLGRIHGFIAMASGPKC